jgi:hypothetical protein
MAMQECDGSTPPPTPTTYKYTRCIQPFVDGASIQPWHRCVAHTVRGNDCDALDSTRILQRSGGFNSRNAIAISERGSSRTIQNTHTGYRRAKSHPKPGCRIERGIAMGTAWHCYRGGASPTGWTPRGVQCSKEHAGLVSQRSRGRSRSRTGSLGGDRDAESESGGCTGSASG